MGERVDAEDRARRLGCGGRKPPQLDDEIQLGAGDTRARQCCVEQSFVAFPALVNLDHNQAAWSVRAALSQPVDPALQVADHGRALSVANIASSFC